MFRTHSGYKIFVDTFLIPNLNTIPDRLSRMMLVNIA
jgi:hypothetical protein